jgi:rare lipoprotein A
MGLGSVLVGPSQQRQKVRGHVEANDSAIAADGSGEPVLRQLGLASYYADKYQGKPKANGQPYDAEALTAASRDLPLGTHATVTNQANGKSVDVTIDDRGPTIEGRIIDLSKQAAERLDMTRDGVTPVRIEARPSQQPTRDLTDKVRQEAAQ